MLSKAEKLMFLAQRQVKLRFVELIVVNHDDFAAVAVHTDVVQEWEPLTHDLVVRNKHRAFSVKFYAFLQVTDKLGLHDKDLPSASPLIERVCANCCCLFLAIIVDLHRLSSLCIKGKMVLGVSYEIVRNMILK